MLDFFHGITMFLAIVLMSLWMLMVLIALIKSEILNLVAERWKPLGIALLVMVFAYVMRIWYLTAMDVQDLVNYTFGSCEPIDISNFRRL